MRAIVSNALFLTALVGFLATGQTSALAFSIQTGISDYRVFQRDDSDTATFVVSGSSETDGPVTATLSEEGGPVSGFEKIEAGIASGGIWTATLAKIPVGGPYEIKLSLGEEAVTVSHVLVGDLWLLAGQSNMQGVGDVIDVEAPSDRVNAFRMRRVWDNAVEPLHRLYESPDAFHLRGKDQQSREQADETAKNQTKGAGLGLPFAKQMVARTGVPIGLVPVAHGGTSMDQWNPDLRDQGGASLYGSMLATLEAVGGRVTGALWYQGESDSGNPKLTEEFSDKFVRLVEAFREDTGNPELPFYWVQIGRFVRSTHSTEGWNAIQEHQRNLEGKIAHSGFAASVDLALDDLIHIGTPGLKVLGERLANLAIGGTSRGPRLQGVEKIPGGLRVAFGEVNERLLPETLISGFSVHDASGEELSMIYKTRVDPEKHDAVLLYLIEEAPEGAALYYGYGLDPFCNLRDAKNMAAPAFGPVEIP